MALQTNKRRDWKSDHRLSLLTTRTFFGWPADMWSFNQELCKKHQTVAIQWRWYLNQEVSWIIEQWLDFSYSLDRFLFELPPATRLDSSVTGSPAQFSFKDLGIEVKHVKGPTAQPTKARTIDPVCLEIGQLPLNTQTSERSLSTPPWQSLLFFHENRRSSTKLGPALRHDQPHAVAQLAEALLLRGTHQRLRREEARARPRWS